MIKNVRKKGSVWHLLDVCRHQRNTVITWRNFQPTLCLSSVVEVAEVVLLQMMKVTVLAESSFIFSPGSLRYADVYRCKKWVINMRWRRVKEKSGADISLFLLKNAKALAGLMLPSDRRITISSAYAFTTNALLMYLRFKSDIFWNRNQRFRICPPFLPISVPGRNKNLNIAGDWICDWNMWDSDFASVLHKQTHHHFKRRGNVVWTAKEILAKSKKTYRLVISCKRKRKSTFSNK